MEKKKLYEFECNTNSMTARQFFNYVNREFKKRTGENFGWLDDFDTFSSPYIQSNSRRREAGQLEEICVLLPFATHLYLRDTYNFIMEYDDGHGYCYAVEYEV